MKQNNTGKLIIGLTGNIGCGKSSVSDVLRDNGFEIIDADKIAREIFEMKSVIEEIKLNFPTVVDGDIIDRKKLGSIVFSSSDKLKILNGITHGKIYDIIKDRISNSNFNKIVVDAALLLEAGFQRIVDCVVVVYCEEKIQVQRVVARDNISVKEAEDRINSQMKQADKVSMSDYIIENSGSWDKTEKQVYDLIHRLCNN